MFSQHSWLKAQKREGKVGDVTSKGDRCCIALPFMHIVPKSLARQRKDPFLGVHLCSNVFLPLHVSRRPSKGRDAAACAPAREKAERTPCPDAPGWHCCRTGFGRLDMALESFVGCPMQSPACPTVLLRQVAADHLGKSWNFSLSQNELTPPF